MDPEEEAPEFDGPDTDGHETFACPKCGKSMYADAVRCPYCGDYVTPGARPSWGLPWWIWIGVILALAVLAGWMFR